jgi:hypothetical protein
MKVSFHRVVVFLGPIALFNYAPAHALGPETDQAPLPARVRAFGGAVTSLREPFNAPLLQPAAVSYVDPAKEPVIHAPEVIFEYTSGFGGFYNQLEGGDTTASMLRDAAAQNPDRYNHLMVGSMAAVFEKNIAYGWLTDYTYDTLYESTTARLHQTNYFTNTLFLNAAKDFGSERQFSWGINLKMSYRYGSNNRLESYEQDNRTIGLRGSAREGLGLGLDSGILYQKDLSQRVKLGFGAAAVNLGGLIYAIKIPFFEAQDNGNPRPLDMQINTGVNVWIENFLNLDLFDARFALDGKNLTRWSDVDGPSHAAFGAELRFRKFITLLGGMQGLGWSGGIDLRYWLVNVTFTVYNEEVGRMIQGSKKNFRWLFDAKFTF